MKKRIKLSLLVAMLVIVLPFFFKKMAAEEYDGWKVLLVKESGEEKPLEDLQINGELYDTQVYSYNEFKFKNGRTQYENNDSYLARMDQTFSLSPVLMDYYNQYKNYLRGKELSAFLFSEDPKFLSYSNVEREYKNGIPKDALIFSRLDKKSKKEEAESIPLDSTDSSYSYVSGTYYENNKLTVLVQHVTYPENLPVQKENYSVYIWNFDTDRLETEGKKVLFPNNDEAKKTISYIVLPTESDASLSVAAFHVQTGDSFDETGELKGNTSEKLYSLDYKTMDVKEIMLPDGMDTLKYTNESLIQGNLYLFDQKTGKVHVANLTDESPIFTPLLQAEPAEEYSPEELNDSDDFEDQGGSFEMNEETSDTIVMESEGYISKVMETSNKYFYIMDINGVHKRPAKLEIYDLSSKELVYKGKLEVEKTGKPTTNYEVSIPSLYVTKP